MSRPKVSDEIRCIVQQFRGDINTVGGIFQHGKAYSHAKKIQVAAAYRVASNAVGGGRPNISQLQRDCQVSRGFVRKVESELRKYGTIITPSEIQARRRGPWVQVLKYWMRLILQC